MPHCEYRDKYTGSHLARQSFSQVGTSLLWLHRPCPAWQSVCILSLLLVIEICWVHTELGMLTMVLSQCGGEGVRAGQTLVCWVVLLALISRWLLANLVCCLWWRTEMGCQQSQNRHQTSALITSSGSHKRYSVSWQDPSQRVLCLAVSPVTQIFAWFHKHSPYQLDYLNGRSSVVHQTTYDIHIVSTLTSEIS